MSTFDRESYLADLARQAGASKPSQKHPGRDNLGRFLAGEGWVPPPNYKPLGSPENPGGRREGTLKRDLLRRCKQCGSTFMGWGQARYCSLICRVRAHEQRKRRRGILNNRRVKLGQMKRLSKQQRWYFTLVDRIDDPAKGQFARTLVPALSIPLTTQMEDALARLYAYTKGDPGRLLISTPTRPLSINKEAVATASGYERMVHDLLLWALRIAIEPPFRGWLRSMMKGKTTRRGSAGRNAAFRKHAPR